jgi:aspartyl/asparaginyl-tRNA synthetase
MKELSTLGSTPDGTEVTVRARVYNARLQSAKLVFLNLREGYSSIQAVIAASDTISRSMVKFAGGLSVNSVVEIVGVVKEAPEPIKSASITNRELHISQVWVVSRAIPQLPIQPEDVEFAVPNDGDQSTNDSGRVNVGLSTRLDHRVIDLSSTLNHAIFEIRSGAHRLFEEYLRSHDFLKIDSPKLLGASSEGGADVFEVKYFEQKAYLGK